VVPGALNVDGKRLVRYDEEGNRHIYHADIDSNTPSIDISSNDQLEQMIPNAQDRQWIPAENFVIL
jgi:hypothetical protein